MLVKKPKTAAYTAVAVLLIAGLSVACTFTGGRENAELAEPFGKHYVEEATVACAPGYMNDPIGGELEVVADRDSDDVRTLLLKRMDNEAEQLYETVAEVTLTKEEFDVRFNSKTDGPTEWLVDGLSAAKRAARTRRHGCAPRPQQMKTVGQIGYTSFSRRTARSIS